MPGTLKPLAHPIGRQFRVEPASLDASSLAATSPRHAQYSVITVITKPPRSRTTRGRLFFSTGRNGTSASAVTLSTCWAISGCSLALANNPATVQIGLPPCLVVNFPFDGGKACWINHQAIQPLRLAFGQEPSRLVRDGGWRGCRRAVGTLTLSSSLFLVPAHLLFRLQKHFHNKLFPSCQSPVSFGLRPFAYLTPVLFRCVTAFWDRTPRHCFRQYRVEVGTDLFGSWVQQESGTDAAGKRDRCSRKAGQVRY